MRGGGPGTAQEMADFLCCAIRIQTEQNLIFQHYHNWEVINRLIETTPCEGAGERYLIQHSSGSGGPLLSDWRSRSRLRW